MTEWLLWIYVVGTFGTWISMTWLNARVPLSRTDWGGMTVFYILTALLPGYSWYHVVRDVRREVLR